MYETMLPPQNQKQAADGDAVSRLALDLHDLVGAEWRDRNYGVAVSGGPDSMALLWLMATLLPGRVAGATVDHRLRDASGDEARMVADYCARMKIPHTILEPAAPIRGSLQAAARKERYRLLDQWRCGSQIDHIVTAHHADDQLETIIMRLNRSSGVGGLAAIRAANGHVLRPLLEWRRSDLARVAHDQDLPCVDDPSNRDARFDRARLRHLLSAQTLIDPVAAGRSARCLADADTALDWAAEQAICAWPDAQDPHIIRDYCYPPEILRRIVLRRLCAIDARLALRGAALDGVLLAMREGRRAMAGRLLIDRLKNTDGTVWRISEAPRRSVPKKA